MTVTLTTSGHLLLRADIAHSPEGHTYYAVRAPHVRGTLTIHPEADPGHREDPDAYTGLCITFGRYDPAESPASYTDRIAVYNSWLYGGISLRTVTLSPHVADPTCDPWNRVHRSPYELAEPPTRQRIKDELSPS